jgi:UPF0755 protein
MFRRVLQRISDIISGVKFTTFKTGFHLRNWLISLKSKKSVFQESFTRIKLILKKVSGWKYVPHLSYPKSLKFNKFRLAILLSATAGIIITAIWILIIHPKFYHLNVKKTVIIYIRGNSNFEQVLEDLKSRDILENVNTFNWLANKRNYPAQMKPGAYKLEEGWSNKKILDVLISGIQTPVKVTFNNIRFRENLAGRLAHCFESDSTTFLSWLNNDSLAKAMGFTHESFPGLFIPNTYEFYWTTSPKKFIERMKKEYDIFWNDARKSKAKSLELSIGEVITLASIVQEETVKEDEKPKIAGVYINRLRKNWNLQADPTVKFALGDFSIKRILNKYTDIDSPYNTYKHKGLPPGPINFPEIQSIDAVLNAEKSDYMYFCAKDDFSGYHNFSRTLSEHLNYARSYQEALNRNKILR